MEFVDYILLVMLSVTVLTGIEILKRLPRPSRSIKEAKRPPDWKTFAVWLYPQKPMGVEFKAGLQNDFESGLEFHLTGHADSNEHLPEIKRATVGIYSSIGRELRTTEVFGRANAKDQLLEMSVFLPPANVAELLNFIKGEPQVLVHAQGFFANSGKIEITYFTCEPTSAKPRQRIET